MRTDDDLNELIKRRREKDIPRGESFRQARSALLRAADQYEREIDEILLDCNGQLSEHDQNKINTLQNWAICERRGAVRLDEMELELKQEKS